MGRLSEGTLCWGCRVKQRMDNGYRLVWSSGRKKGYRFWRRGEGGKEIVGEEEEKRCLGLPNGVRSRTGPGLKWAENGSLWSEGRLWMGRVGRGVGVCVHRCEDSVRYGVHLQVHASTFGCCQRAEVPPTHLSTSAGPRHGSQSGNSGVRRGGSIKIV